MVWGKVRVIQPVQLPCPQYKKKGVPAASQPGDPSPVNVTNNNAEDIPPTDQTGAERSRLQKIAEELEKEGLTEFKEAECLDECQNFDLPNYTDLFDPDAKFGKFFF